MSVPKNILASPSSRDFYSTFLFLVHQIDPHYTLPEKDKEEAIVTLLKHFGCPYTISKSALKTFTSQHTWTHILCMLCWLCEYCMYAEASAPGAKQGFSEIDEFNDVEFFEFTARVYAQWMTGVDVTVTDTDFVRDLDARHAQQEEEKRRIEAEMATYTAEMDKLKNIKAAIAQLEQQQADCASDEVKFKLIVAKAEKSKAHYADKLRETQQDLADLREHIASLEREQQSLQSVVNSQDITPQEVEQLAKRKETLMQTRRMLREQCDKLHEVLSEAKTELAEGRDKLDAAMDQFNTLTRKLSAVPGLGESAPRFSLLMRSDGDQLLNVNLDREVRPLVSRMKALCSELLHQEMAHDNEMCKKLSETQSVRLERGERVKSLEARLKRAQDTARIDRERVEREVDVLVARVTELEEEVEHLQGDEMSQVSRADAKLSRLEDEYRRLQQQQGKERAELNDLVCRMTDEVAQHLSDINSDLVDVEARARSAKLQMLEH
jgi:SMC interacting uncharacterized protein involved in chromosome segregation